MRADFARPGIGLAVAVERAGMAAFGIVRAADEGAMLAELEIEPPVFAGRADARVHTILGKREQVRRQGLVEDLDDLLDAQFRRFVDGALEVGPEAAQHLVPVDLAVRYIVELGFERRREVIFDIAAEIILQEHGDDAAAILGDEAAALQAHVIAVLQYRYDRGIGRGPADAELFELLDQAGLGKARRRFGEMLLGRNRGEGQRLALLHARQPALAILALGVVAAFLIEAQEAVKGDHRAGGAQAVAAVAGLDDDGGLVDLGARHLARQGAFPDQLVEPRLIVAEQALHLFGQPREIGRADRFMRFLGVLGLGAVGARLIGHIAGAVFALDGGARTAHGLLGDVHAVGAHIGNQPDPLAVERHAFVKLLRHAHGLAGGEGELARGFLLQGGSGEGRRRIAPRAPGLDLTHGVPAGGDDIARGHGAGLVGKVELVEFFAVEMGQAGFDRGPGGGLQLRRDGPIFAPHEGLDGGLALANQAQRHRLHAPRRARSRQLAPQDRRQRETDQIIERPARPVGIDQIIVEPARIGHSGEHGGLGDFAEHHPLDGDAVEELALVQLVHHMP